MKESKLLYILIGVIAALIGGLSLLTWFRLHTNGEFPWTRFLLSLGGTLMLAAGMGVGAYYIFRRKEAQDKKQVEDEIRPDPAGTMEVVELTKELFPEINKMPRTYNQKKKQWELLKKEDLEIINTRPFSDPKNQTVADFWRFEVMVRSGRRMGLALIHVRLDLGIEYIRENFNSFITWHVSAREFELEPDKLPLVNSKEGVIRYANMMADLVKEEGFTFTEANKILAPYAAQPIVQTETLPKAKPIQKKEQQQEQEKEDGEGEDVQEEYNKRYTT